MLSPGYVNTAGVGGSRFVDPIDGRRYDEGFGSRVADDPDYSIQQPDYSLQQPDYSLQQTEYSIQQPEYSIQQPDYSSQAPDYSNQLNRSTMNIPRLELPSSQETGQLNPPHNSPGRFQFNTRSSSWCALPVTDQQGGYFGESNAHTGNIPQRRSSDREIPNNSSWDNELSVYVPERRSSADNRDTYQSWDRRQARQNQYRQGQRSAEVLPFVEVTKATEPDPVNGNTYNNGNGNSNRKSGNFSGLDFCKIVAATVRKETGVSCNSLFCKLSGDYWTPHNFCL